MIKAIKTRYKGILFRSRLEARWAVLFDELGLTWAYEPEGIDLGATGWYLPDFWINDVNCYFEVKPKEASAEEVSKVYHLSVQSKNPVVLAEGYIYSDRAVYDTRRYLDDRADGAQFKSRMRVFAGEAWAMWKHGVDGWDFLEMNFAPNRLPVFLREEFSGEWVPEGDSEENRKRLVELDCKYFMQKHGREHPSYTLGRRMNDVFWIVRQDGSVGLASQEHGYNPERIIAAYEAAASWSHDQ